MREFEVNSHAIIIILGHFCGPAFPSKSYFTKFTESLKHNLPNNCLPTHKSSSCISLKVMQIQSRLCSRTLPPQFGCFFFNATTTVDVELQKLTPYHASLSKVTVGLNIYLIYVTFLIQSLESIFKQCGFHYQVKRHCYSLSCA